LLPQSLARLNGAGVPAVALRTLAFGSAIIAVAIPVLGWNVESVFLLVSQNWFILYVLSILAFLTIETSKAGRTVGGVALLLSFAFMQVFSVFLLVPAAILAGLWVGRRHAGS
jgi:hypothetical protein